MVRHIRKIRRIVDQLLQRAGIEEPEVNVVKIAETLGIEIRHKPLGEDVGEDVSGLLFREGNQVIIGINSEHHRNRQRFTLAHEIGHHQLHSHTPLYVDKVFPVRRRDQRSAEAVDIEEIEANAFAAELLMPAKMLEQEPELQRDIIDHERDIAALAERYGVSQQAMTFRLINLGIINSSF